VRTIKTMSFSILMMTMMTVTMKMLPSFQIPFQLFDQAKYLDKIQMISPKSSFFNSVKKRPMPKLTTYANK
jgi:hypothetical protein